MRYRTLGRTGIQVSPYALGAMNFGAVGNPDHDDAVRIIHRALDAGINLIDTAGVYSHGESEEIVGQAIKGRRDDVVLATKFSSPMDEALNRRGASRRWIMTVAEDSLRRLQTDYIDLYQYHRPDTETDIEETLSTLSDLVRSGKVRAIGTSKLPAADIVGAQWAAERRGFERFRCSLMTCSLAPRPCSATASSTASTRSSRPAPTSASSRWPITRPPSPIRHCGDVRSASAPPRKPDRIRVRGNPGPLDHAVSGRAATAPRTGR